jgi:hypothetical protein
MPSFGVGQAKTASVRMKNPTARDLSYYSRLYLGTTIISEQTFSLLAKEQKDVLFPVVIPNTPGTYPVAAEVFYGGKSIALYQDPDYATISLIDPNIALLSVVWTPSAIASDFLVSSQQTAQISFSLIGTAWQSFYTFEVNLVLAGVVKARGQQSISGYSGGNLYADIQMPSTPGEYDVIIKAYQSSVLTGAYPGGKLTVYGIAEPSNLAYENLSFSLSRPYGTVWLALNVACDIRNTGNATITREVALWYHSGPPYGWHVVTQPPYQGNAGRIILTLAPGEVFHYVYVGEYLMNLAYNIELRDNMGGKSAYIGASG